MYEYEKAQVKAQHSSSTPQYGGDCALKQDGLSTSLKRMQEVTSQLNQATWQLRAFFGFDSPEGSSIPPRPSGIKGAIDEAISSVGASLENVKLILEHLHS